MKKKAQKHGFATISIPEKSMFLYGEDPEGWTPKKVNEWIEEHDNDQSLADMLSQVHNHVGILMHALEDGDCDKGTFDLWNSVEGKLVGLAIRKLPDETPDTAGAFNKIKPFMERHGYIDGGGWWIPEKEDGRPASVYVPISDIEERKNDLFDLFTGLTLTAHTSSDDGYEDIEDGYTEYTIGDPGAHSQSSIWLLVPEGYGEITFGVGEWHAHYDWYEHDLQCLEWEITQVVAGKTQVLCLYSNDHLIGTTLFRGEPRNKTYWQLLNHFHLDSEQKRELKESGARFSFISPTTRKRIDIAFSESFATS